jgi:hypothetical protein
LPILPIDREGKKHMAVFLVLDGLMLVHWKEDTIDILIPSTEFHEFKLGGRELPSCEIEAHFEPSGVSGNNPDIGFLSSHFCLNGMKVRREPNPDPSPRASLIGLPKPRKVYGAYRYVTQPKALLNGEDPSTVHGQPSRVLMFCERIVLEYAVDRIKIEGETATEGGYIRISATDRTDIVESPGHGMASFNALLSLPHGKGGSNRPQYRVTGLSSGEALRIEDDDHLPIEVTEEMADRTIKSCGPNFLVDVTAAG